MFRKGFTMKNQKKVRKAVIPAAGLGTRFLPATKALAKEMLPIIDKPTIQYIVEEAKKSGIEDILVVTGKGKRQSKITSIPFLNWNKTLRKRARRNFCDLFSKRRTSTCTLSVSLIRADWAMRF